MAGALYLTFFINATNHAECVVWEESSVI